MKHRPLAGVRVLEVSRLVPGAAVGWWLAALGADVVKLEEPVRGDYTRAIPPYVDGVGLMHQVSDEGKRSVAADLGTPAGMRTFRSLAAVADVIIDGVRPGAMERYGIDYRAMCADRPELIVCSVTGFGQHGPLADLGAHGTTIDSLAGVAPIREGPNGDLALAWELSSTIGIETGALSAVVSILASVMEVRAGSRGSWIDVSLWDAAVHANRFATVWALTGEPEAMRLAQTGPLNAPYRCADGNVLWFAPIELKFWTRFCSVTGRPDLLARWDGQGEVGFGSESIRAELAALFRTRPAQDWADLLKSADIPANRVLLAHDVIEHPHFAARYPAGEAQVGSALRTIGAAPVWMEEGQRLGVGLAPAPTLGADTDEVICEWTGEGIRGESIARTIA